MKTKIKLFENKQIRASWNSDEEEWYFSVVDIVAVLTESIDATAYWRKLKQRLKSEGNETVTNCHALKMKAIDGKMRLTDVLSTEGIFRLVQSIPSKKAEPFKMWLAKVGNERLDEIANPEKAFERGIEYYRNKGYQEEWIRQRLKSIDIRRKLTEQYNLAGISDSKDYAILTNEMTKTCFGVSVKDFKKIKGLKKESLRDNMTDLELILNSLAEVTTTELCQTNNPIGLNQTKEQAIAGGTVAGNARKEIETRLGHSTSSFTKSKDKK